MANFDSGVKRFIKAKAIIEVGFPVDWKDNPDVSCKQCNFYVRATQRCALNQKIVEYPERHIGSQCPLEFMSEEEENV